MTLFEIAKAIGIPSLSGDFEETSRYGKTRYEILVHDDGTMSFDVPDAGLYSNLTPEDTRALRDLLNENIKD